MRRILKWSFGLFLIWWLRAWSPMAKAIVDAPLQMAQGVVSVVELHNLQQLVLMQRHLDDQFPDEATFKRIVGTNLDSMTKNPAIDMWGSPYRYRLIENGFELRSAGPDCRCDTSDDLVLRWKENRS
jgi:hypothetical protein